MNYISMIKGVAAKTSVKLAKYAPHILVGTGIVTVTAGTIGMVKGATHADDIIEKFDEEMDKIEQAKELAANKKSIYTRKDEMEDKMKVYGQTAVAVIKKNWVPITLYVSGVVMICSGVHILNKRYVGVAASYAALHKSYSDYRKRVVEEQGSDADFRFANGVSKGSYNYTEVDEDGNQKDVNVESDKVVNESNLSVYSVLFDEMSTMWTPNPISNMSLIRRVEDYWNEPAHFEHRGFVYYYEVLKDLGIWESLPYEKQKVLVDKGWVWGAGDNHISLGIFDVDVEKPMSFAKADFIQGYEPSVLIEPNIDGIVAELL